MYYRKAVSIFAVLMFVFIVSNGTALAVPASPYISTLIQADGTTFEARQWGDENSHGWQTASGYSIIRDEASSSWYYAQQDMDGFLVKSDVRAEEKAPDGLPAYLRPGKKAAKEIAQKREEMGTAGNIVSSGTLQLPIVLIDFPDLAHSKTKYQLHNVLFGNAVTGPGNLQDYYWEVSNRQLTVTPGRDMPDWVTADKPRASYGANNTFGNDIDPAALVAEAIRKADDSVDFSQYAVNGEVPAVIVVHSGYDESLGASFASEDDIWAHNWSLSNAGYGALTVDGVIVNNYTIQSELTSNAAYRLGGYTQSIGVFAHELGHVLNCPDTYDTSGATEGAGRWDLMGNGSWNSIKLAGDTPSHMSAFFKYYLGWIQPKTAAANSTVTMKCIEDASEEIYLLGSNPGGVDWSYKNHRGTGEYFLLENRSAEKFNSAIPGKGLLIWHVDETAVYNNRANAVAPYLLALEQADGRYDLEKKIDKGDEGDPWPGEAENNIFNDTSVPDSRLHNGAASGIALSNIVRDNNGVSFDYGSVFQIMGGWEMSFTWESGKESVQTVTFSGIAARGSYITSEGEKGEYRVEGKSVNLLPEETGAVYWGSFSGETQMDGMMQDSQGGSGTWTAIRKSDLQETPVLGVFMKWQRLNMKVIYNYQLLAEVIPKNASNPGLLWYSSNPSVARVNADGYVSALSAGTAVITAETIDGGFRDTCTVSVWGELTDQTGPYIDVFRSDTGERIMNGAIFSLSCRDIMKMDIDVYDKFCRPVKRPALKITSSDKEVCTAGRLLLRTGKKKGTAIITIRDTVNGTRFYFEVHTAEEEESAATEGKKEQPEIL